MKFHVIGRRGGRSWFYKDLSSDDLEIACERAQARARMYLSPVNVQFVVVEELRTFDSKPPKSPEALK